jgi:hypothetical protein
VKTILSALAFLLCLSTATLAADPPFKPTPIRFAPGTSGGMSKAPSSAPSATSIRWARGPARP